jgi:hypothetical protein
MLRLISATRVHPQLSHPFQNARQTMPLRFSIRLAETALVLLLAAAVILAWREARSDRAQLQAQLAAANQALAAATARQQDRDAKLSDVLTNIAAEKKAATTPDQLLAGIAREIGLPALLTLQAGATSLPAGRSTPSTTAESEGNPPSGTTLQADAATSLSPTVAPGARLPSTIGPAQMPSAPEAKIPAADLKPLYDYVLDCKACQAKLTAAQSDLADEKSKTVTLTKSRDDALRATEGGSIWKRTARALKWFAIGAAAGAIAAKTAR